MHEIYLYTVIKVDKLGSLQQLFFLNAKTTLKL